MQDPNKYVNQYLPTAQDVVDLVFGRVSYGYGTTAQARLLKEDLTPYNLPVPLDPNDPTALCSLQQSWVTDIKEEVNTTTDVYRKCTFRMYEWPGINQFNTLTNLIQMSTQYYRVINNVLTLILDVPVAIYQFIIPDRTLLDSGNVWDITGHGQTQRIRDIGFENRYTIPKLSNVVNGVRAMLQMDGLPPSQGGRLPTNAPVGPGICSGCLPPSATGTAAGYCQQGYATTDPQSGTTPYGSGPALRQRLATGMGGSPVLYSTTIGLKLDSTSGAPIDPFSCLVMTVATVCPGAIGSSVPGEMVPGEIVAGQASYTTTCFPAFICSKLTALGNAMYLDTSTGYFYDAVTGDQVDPETGATSTSTSVTAFSSRGGDGGLGTAHGNVRGYCPSFGFAVSDPSSLAMPGAPGSRYYQHFVGFFGHNVTYDSQMSFKIDAATGYPIDPWNCQMMAPYPTPNPKGDLFYTSRVCGGDPVLFDPATGLFWNTSYAAVDPDTCTAPIGPVAPDVFDDLGGDGGVSTLPPGAVGPIAGSLGPYVWPDGNNPGLTPAGCEDSGPNLPARRILSVASSQVQSETVTFDPSFGNKLKACNDQLATIMYWPLGDDHAGNILIQPMPFQPGVVPTPDPYFVYTTGADGVIDQGVIQKINAQNAIANKVVIRSENNKTAALVAVAYNRSPSSFISVDNMGRVIQQQPVIRLDQITDIAILQLRAFIEINFAALGAESIEMTVPINPFFELHDVIGINIYSPDGKVLEIDSSVNPFLVDSWSIDHATRTMKIVAGRLVPL